MEQRWQDFLEECVVRIQELKGQLIAEGMARGITKRDAAAAFEAAETATAGYVRQVMRRRKGRAA